MRLAGFPLRIRPGFAVFVVLVVLAYGGARGVWLAAALTVLTLTHELGHAFAARRYGAEAEIALDFVAGYTSFSPSRPLTNSERAIIAVSGPLAEIIPGIVALMALGANPLSIHSSTATVARQAFWWAGPVLGLVNLIPLIPLDGGSVITSALDVAAPGRGRKLALTWSLAVTGGLALVMITTPRLRPLLVFAAFMIALQVQQLVALRRQNLRPHHAAQTVVASLLDAGRPLEAAREGSRQFEVTRDATLAIMVARSAAQLGELATAMAWVQAAGHASDDPVEVLADFDLHEDFAQLRQLPGAVTLRHTLGG